jgi:hypothetical protein
VEALRAPRASHPLERSHAQVPRALLRRPASLREPVRRRANWRSSWAVLPPCRPGVGSAGPGSARRLARPLCRPSGFCALTYQVAWTRGFRLSFGASTAASAAVLAVFMGGLGLGAWLLGKRTGPFRAPLLLYAALEGLVALFAAASPAVHGPGRQCVPAAGRSVVLGTSLGTLVRLALAALVCCPPPCSRAARSARRRGSTESESDLPPPATALLWMQYAGRAARVPRHHVLPPGGAGHPQRPCGPRAP